MSVVVSYTHVHANIIINYIQSKNRHMHSLYRIVVGVSQYVLSAVTLMMETVSYQWVHLACLVVFAIPIAKMDVNQSL